jgi:hypothetical protein
MSNNAISQASVMFWWAQVIRVLKWRRVKR